LRGLGMTVVADIPECQEQPRGDAGLLAIET
jgi:hypothetical protein